MSELASIHLQGQKMLPPPEILQGIDILPWTGRSTHSPKLLEGSRANRNLDPSDSDSKLRALINKGIENSMRISISIGNDKKSSTKTVLGSSNHTIKSNSLESSPLLGKSKSSKQLDRQAQTKEFLIQPLPKELRPKSKQLLRQLPAQEKKKCLLFIETLEFDAQTNSQGYRGSSAESRRYPASKPESRSQARSPHNNEGSNIPDEHRFHKVFIPTKIKKQLSIEKDNLCLYPPFKTGIASTRTSKSSSTTPFKAKESASQHNSIEESHRVRSVVQRDDKNNDTNIAEGITSKRNSQPLVTPLKNSSNWINKFNDRRVSRINFLGMSNLEVKQNNFGKKFAERTRPEKGLNREEISSQTSRKNYKELIDKMMRNIQQEQKNKLTVDIVRLEANPISQRASQKTIPNAKQDSLDAFSNQLFVEKKRSKKLHKNRSAVSIQTVFEVPLTKEYDHYAQRHGNISQPLFNQSAKLSILSPTLDMLETPKLFSPYNKAALRRSIPMRAGIPTLSPITFIKKE